MTRLVRIEQALRGLDDATFHQLCDALLVAEGYPPPSSSGLKLGVAKAVKGHPDSVIELDDGTYGVCEYTTQQTQLGTKLRNDLEKCFDPQQCGVRVDEISRAFVATVAIIPAGLREELRAIAPCPVEIWDGSEIAQAIYQRHPRLARDFLGLPLDTGQVVPIEEFVADVGRERFSTGLAGEFAGRESELQSVIDAISEYPVVLLTGPPGVGKTRLAVEALRGFAEDHPDYRTACVRHRGLELFEDLHTHLDGASQWLVLVDDANRLPGLQHLLQLQQDRLGSGAEVRIVMTVRGYAHDEVASLVDAYAKATSQRLGQLTDDAIRAILVDDYTIRHGLFQQRIVDIAKGNPRLARMAAKVVQERQTIDSLHDASDIYDRYYAPVIDDAGLSQSALAAAGILGLFKFIDMSDPARLTLFHDVFGVTEHELRDGLGALHALEVADIYEGEVARVADQQFAEYLFFTAFFDRKVLSADALLNPRIFPQYRSQLVEVLNPVGNRLRPDVIAEVMRTAVIAALDGPSGSETGYRDALYESFSLLIPDRAIRLVRDQVGAMMAGLQCDSEQSLLNVEVSTETRLLWRIIGQVGRHPNNYGDMALELAVRLTAKRPDEVGVLLDFLTKGIGISADSAARGFRNQYAVLDQLDRAIDGEQNADRARLLHRVRAAVVERWLRTEFESTESETSRAVSITRITLGEEPQFRELRNRLLERLASDASAGHVSEVLGVIRRYAADRLHISEHAVLAADAPAIIAILRTASAPQDYAWCRTVQRYHDCLARCADALREEDRKAIERLASSCRSSAAQVTRYMLGEELHLGLVRGVDYEEAESSAKASRQKWASSFTEVDWRGLLADLAEARELEGKLYADDHPDDQNDGFGYGRWQWESHGGELLDLCAQQSSVLYADILVQYLASGDPMSLQPEPHISRLSAILGTDTLLAKLQAADFTARPWWILAALQATDPGEFRPQDRALLLKVAASTDPRYVVFRWDKLAGLEEVSGGLVRELLELLMVHESKEEGVKSQSLRLLFNPHAHSLDLASLFRDPDGADLLIRAYFAANLADPHVDYDATYFSLLCDLDPTFPERWVQWRVTNANGSAILTSRSEWRVYQRLWLRDDWEQVCGRLLRACLNGITDDRWFDAPYAGAFLRISDGCHDRLLVVERQDRLLGVLMREVAGDVAKAGYLLGTPGDERQARQKMLVGEFLAVNPSFDDFRRLPLEPRIWVSWGSEVPGLERRISYLESLLPLMEGLDYLDHRSSIERQIDSLRKSIIEARRSEFMDQ